MKNILLTGLLVISILINAQNETEPASNEKIFTIVDDMPSFPGGESQLVKFFKKNLKYPRHEKEAQITGSCFITFVVEKDGHVNNIQILQGVEGGPGCDLEVMRVANLMPAWIPGKHHGACVRTQYNLPIKFSLY
ncbi:MAG TPA: energy transducer TonB [Bacteroidia bacterium]|jgi:protein TonB|nr:energy transducer TonB [Bacteroidia bacterium]